MISMLISGELRLSRIFKLVVAAIPMLLFLVVLAFILYGRWKEKRGDRATDDR